MHSLINVKLAIWDLDGTIIDSYGVFLAVVTEAAELSGHVVPDAETIRHNYHGTLDATLKAIFNMVDNEIAAEQLLNDFLRIQERYYEHPDEHIFPDALHLAARLHEQGIDQVVVTNRAHEGRGTASPRYLIAHSKMQPFIKDFVCGDDAPVNKPDAAVLQYLQQPLQAIEPSEMIVIGDQYVDAQLARNLGCDAILTNRNPEPIPHLEQLGDEIEFLHIVSSLDEVK